MRHRPRALHAEPRSFQNEAAGVRDADARAVRARTCRPRRRRSRPRSVAAHVVGRRGEALHGSDLPRGSRRPRAAHGSRGSSQRPARAVLSLARERDVLRREHRARLHRARGARRAGRGARGARPAGHRDLAADRGSRAARGGPAHDAGVPREVRLAARARARRRERVPVPRLRRRHGQADAVDRAGSDEAPGLLGVSSDARAARCRVHARVGERLDVAAGDAAADELAQRCAIAHRRRAPPSAKGLLRPGVRRVNCAPARVRESRRAGRKPDRPASPRTSPRRRTSRPAWCRRSPRACSAASSPPTTPRGKPGSSASSPRRLSAACAGARDRHVAALPRRPTMRGLWDRALRCLLRLGGCR